MIKSHLLYRLSYGRMFFSKQCVYYMRVLKKIKRDSIFIAIFSIRRYANPLAHAGISAFERAAFVRFPCSGGDMGKGDAVPGSGRMLISFRPADGPPFVDSPGKPGFTEVSYEMRLDLSVT